MAMVKRRVDDGSGSVAAALPWWVPVAAVAVLAALLRWWRIDAQPLRLDEAWSVWVATNSPAGIVGVLAEHDTHPPVSYLLQSLWQVVGDSDAAVRSLSVVASVAAVVVVAMLTRSVGGVRAAVTAAVVMAVSPWHIQHANDARMYAIAALAVATALFGAAKVLLDDDGSAPTDALVTYGVAAAAGLLTHNTLVVTMGVIGVATAAVLAADRSWAGLRRWLVTNAVVVGAWALWWPALARQMGRLDSALAWVADPTADQLHAMLAAPWLWVPGGRPGWAGLWLDVAVVAVAGLGAYRLGRVGAVLGAVAIALPLVLVSWDGVTLLDRVLLPSSVAIYPLVAVGLWSLGAWVGAAGTAALVLLAVPGLVSYQQDVRLTAWDEAADTIAAEATDRTGVVYVGNYAQLPLERYHQPAGPTMGLPADFLDDPSGPRAVTPEALDRLDGLLADTDDVWLVYSRQAAEDPDRLVAGYLAERRAVVGCAQLQGVELVHYSVDGSTDPSCG